MLEFTKIALEQGQKPLCSLTLPLELRKKSRQRAQLDNGQTAAIRLPRGTVLMHGDLLATEGGELIEVKAAPEFLSRVRCDQPLLLAKACYHLGNRHVPLQIETGRVSYLHDHVLDDMLRGLGLTVEHLTAPFEPEPGAYGGSGGSGGHHHAH